MKSNPYVYPTIDFPNIYSGINISKNNSIKNVSWKNIEQEIKKIKYKNPKVNGKTTEERIFSIFLDKCFLFGPRIFIQKSKSEFINIIHDFVERKKPVNLSLLGFPFKVEVPLKTNRFLPDMGEILALHKLEFLAKCIKREYSPGVKITIFTEEVFAKFAGVNKIKADAYIHGIKSIIKKLNYLNSIKIISLSKIEKNSKFKKVFSENILEISKDIKYKKGTGYEKYKKSFLSVFRLISTKDIIDNILLSIYNSKNINNLSKIEKIIYKKITKKTNEAIIKYLAYIKTKDDLEFIDKTLSIYLPMSVSPKPGRIGILPINKDINILPYHGVPVKDTKSGKWDIKYLCDIKYNKRKYRSIYLNGDNDKQPFYYLLLR
jgi:hypothetical protein